MFLVMALPVAVALSTLGRIRVAACKSNSGSVRECSGARGLCTMALISRFAGWWGRRRRKSATSAGVIELEEQTIVILSDQ
jgi:hypothetical protein